MGCEPRVAQAILQIGNQHAVGSSIKQSINHASKQGLKTLLMRCYGLGPRVLVTQKGHMAEVKLK